ncbi:hypothetical protein ACFQH3_17555 [Haladaptatus sp. GCM10025707]|uniref:hypothetical protein n=1 Tax=unclassified Haladaptatus TaxID=2622732 RepID=UPI003606DE4C
MARIPYVTDDDLPEAARELLGSYHSMEREFVPHIADPSPSTSPPAATADRTSTARSATTRAYSPCFARWRAGFEGVAG